MSDYETKIFHGRRYWLMGIYPKTKEGYARAKYMWGSMKVMGANARLISQGNYWRLYVDPDKPQRIRKESREFWDSVHKRGIVSKAKLEIRNGKAVVIEG